LKKDEKQNQTSRRLSQLLFTRPSYKLIFFITKYPPEINYRIAWHEIFVGLTLMIFVNLFPINIFRKPIRRNSGISDSPPPNLLLLPREIRILRELCRPLNYSKMIFLALQSRTSWNPIIVFWYLSFPNQSVYWNRKNSNPSTKYQSLKIVERLISHIPN